VRGWEAGEERGASSGMASGNDVTKIDAKVWSVSDRQHLHICCVSVQESGSALLKAAAPSQHE